MKPVPWVLTAFLVLFSLGCASKNRSYPVNIIRANPIVGKYVLVSLDYLEDGKLLDSQALNGEFNFNKDYSFKLSFFLPKENPRKVYKFQGIYSVYNSKVLLSFNNEDNKKTEYVFVLKDENGVKYLTLTFEDVIRWVLKKK